MRTSLCTDVPLFWRVSDQLNLLKYCGINVNGSKERPSRFLQVQLVYGSFATITVNL